jgi:hypothetical protein
MRIPTCLFLFWVVLAAPITEQIFQPGVPTIVAPRPGDVLQGLVQISGSMDETGVVSAELSFTYVDDSTGTWFLIALISQPVINATLAVWDTTVITDGIYVLRLRVVLADGSFRDAIVSGLRVRNYTPVETPTPTARVLEAAPLPTISPTLTLFATPTILPHNPAVLMPGDVSSSILYGGMTAIVIFLIVGIYLWLRRKLS